MDPTRTLELARAAWGAGHYELAAFYYHDLDDRITSGGTRPLDWMVCAL